MIEGDYFIVIDIHNEMHTCIQRFQGETIICLYFYLLLFILSSSMTRSCKANVSPMKQILLALLDTVAAVKILPCFDGDFELDAVPEAGWQRQNVVLEAVAVVYKTAERTNIMKIVL